MCFCSLCSFLLGGVNCSGDSDGADPESAASQALSDPLEVEVWDDSRQSYVDDVPSSDTTPTLDIVVPKTPSGQFDTLRVWSNDEIVFEDLDGGAADQTITIDDVDMRSHDRTESRVNVKAVATYPDAPTQKAYQSVLIDTRSEPLERLMEESDSLRAHYRSPHGATINLLTEEPIEGVTAAERAKAFLAEHPRLFRLAQFDEVGEVLVVDRVFEHEHGTTVTFMQHWRGYPLLGTYVAVQFDESNRVVGVQTDYHPEIESADKVITEALKNLNTRREDALEAAKVEIAAEFGGYAYRQQGDIRPVLYDPSDYDNSAPSERPLALAWKATVEADLKLGTSHNVEVLVDVRSGEAVYAFVNAPNAGRFEVPMGDQEGHRWAGLDACFRKSAHLVCEDGNTGDPAIDCTDTGDPDAPDARETSFAFDEMISDWFQRDVVRSSNGTDYGIVVHVHDKATNIAGDGQAQWRAHCNTAIFDRNVPSNDARSVVHEATHAMSADIVGNWNYAKPRVAKINEHYSFMFEDYWTWYMQGDTTAPMNVDRFDQLWNAIAMENLGFAAHIRDSIDAAEGLNFVYELALNGPPNGGLEFNDLEFPERVNPRQAVQLMYNAIDEGEFHRGASAAMYADGIINAAEDMRETGELGFGFEELCTIRHAFAAQGFSENRVVDDDCDESVISAPLSADQDGDRVSDAQDNCPTTFNPENADQDIDGIGDACDSDVDGDGMKYDPEAGYFSDPCPEYAPIKNSANPSIDIGTTSGHRDRNGNSMADACEDVDNDGYDEGGDNCPYTKNFVYDPITEEFLQSDIDNDGFGDACDPDPDGDGVVGSDACPLELPLSGGSHSDADGDGGPDACHDPDGDGVTFKDNCPNTENPTQYDSDSDGVGDACESDDDDDGVSDGIDNCPKVANASQNNQDSDGIGDACDNCVQIDNQAQTDTDLDGDGNACDSDDDNDGVWDDYSTEGYQHGDDPCSGGNTSECDDNCPLYANVTQADFNDNGIGDRCETIGQTTEIDLRNNFVYRGTANNVAVDLSHTYEEPWPAELNEFPLSVCPNGSGSDCRTAPGIRSGFERETTAVAQEPFEFYIIDDDGGIVEHSTAVRNASGDYEASVRWMPRAGSHRASQFTASGLIQLDRMHFKVLPPTGKKGSPDVDLQVTESYSY